ncbi:hypothetical protein AAE478_000277 [Parahypoxylon ruwenzoriense]
MDPQLPPGGDASSAAAGRFLPDTPGFGSGARAAGNRGSLLTTTQTPTRTHANSGICSRTNTDTNSAPGKKASEPDAAEKQQQQQHQPGAKPRQTGAEDVFAGESSGYRPYENDCYARSRTNGTMNDGMTKVNHRWLKELRSRKWTFQGLKKEADEAKGGETTSSHQRH